MNRLVELLAIEDYPNLIGLIKKTNLILLLKGTDLIYKTTITSDLLSTCQDQFHLIIHSSIVLIASPFRASHGTVLYEIDLIVIYEKYKHLPSGYLT